MALLYDGSRTQARNKGTQCRRAAPDRPMGGRFISVCASFRSKMWRDHKAKTETVLAPTRGLALPSIGLGTTQNFASEFVSAGTKS